MRGLLTYVARYICRNETLHTKPDANDTHPTPLREVSLAMHLRGIFPDVRRKAACTTELKPLPYQQYAIDPPVCDLQGYTTTKPPNLQGASYFNFDLHPTQQHISHSHSRNANPPPPLAQPPMNDAFLAHRTHI